ncbi:putative leucine-rich repeat-containing protein DDB_G0290503 [Saccostrea cucullata]|uniref:putative leucine-rich repeat-containing protein DDB_G0290503 n=1 Tax=Saccostrea cuccullata TaxID=36930 RepID=UPI002ED01461
MDRKSRSEKEYLQRSRSELQARRKQLPGDNEKSSSPKAVSRESTPNSHKRKVSTSSYTPDRGRKMTLSSPQERQTFVERTPSREITSTTFNSPASNTRSARQLNSPSNSGRKTGKSDASKNYQIGRTPSKSSHSSFTNTPLKSSEEKRQKRSETQNTIYESPNINTIKNSEAICKETPKSREKKSYQERELKRMEDSWTKNLSPDDSKRSLRSGLELKDAKLPEPEITKKEKTKRKLYEETFVRRKKLRSEVKDDELWEGILPIRFKRLTPKKQATLKIKTSSQETNTNETKNGGNSSNALNVNKRRSFADLYVEFLVKTEEFSKNGVENVKGSVSNTFPCLDKSTIKCEPVSSKSESDITKSRKAGVNEKELFSIFKEECVSKKNCKLKEKDKHPVPNFKDITDDKKDDDKNISLNKHHFSTSNINSNDKRGDEKSCASTVDDNMVTPKRSARLQEKRTSAKAKSFSDQLPTCREPESSLKKKKSARSLLLEFPDTLGDNTEKPLKDKLVKKRDHEESAKTSANVSRHSTSTQQHEEAGSSKNVQNISKTDANGKTETVKRYQAQKKVRNLTEKQNNNLQANQNSFGMATRRTPKRERCEQKLSEGTNTVNEHREDALGLTNNESKNDTKQTIKAKEGIKESLLGYRTTERRGVEQSKTTKTMSQDNRKKKENASQPRDNKLKSKGEFRVQKSNIEIEETENGEENNKMKNLDVSECSNNATTSTVDISLENSQCELTNNNNNPSLQDTLPKRPEASRNEEHDQDDEKHTINEKQALIDCKISMLQSNSPKIENSFSVVSSENYGVITDILNAILTEVEDSKKTDEAKNKESSSSSSSSCAAHTEETVITSHLSVVRNISSSAKSGPTPTEDISSDKTTDIATTSNQQTVLTATDQSEPKTSSSSINQNPASQTIEETNVHKERKPIKIVMRKTNQGAKIVDKNVQKLKNKPVVVLPRLAASCSSGNPSASRTIEVNVKIESNKTNQNKAKSPVQQNKKIYIGSRDKGKTQTRSRTRSGEGEITNALENPETDLKSPRSKGKIHRKQLKGNNSTERKKIQKGSQKGGKPSTPTRTSAFDLALLQNQTIGKHASILWSSENRRHFQQTHQDLDSAGVEAIMRNAWETLGSKEKLKYYQRAYSATNDENRHSTQKKKPKDNNKDDFTLNAAMTSFLKSNPTKQYEQLKRRLEFVYNISSQAYTKLMEEFKSELQGVKEKVSKKTDMQALYRKLLFQSILDIWDTILQMAQQKREQQRKLIQEEFSDITRKLIVGEGVCFSKTVRSEKLAELLLDLNDLETNSKVSVSGEPIVCSEYDAILDDLLECEFESDDWSILEDLPEANPKLSSEIFSKAISEKKLPELYASCIDADFNSLLEETSVEKLKHISGEFDQIVSQTFENLQKDNTQPCCELNSPSCHLNNWLVADHFRGLTKGGMTDEQTLIDPNVLAQVLKPLKPRKAQEKFLSITKQGVKCEDTNNSSRNVYLQTVPRSYKYPYDMVTLSRSANVISSRVNNSKGQVHPNIRFRNAHRVT